MLQTTWGDSLLPPRDLPPAIAQEFKRAIGTVPRFAQCAAPSPWLNSFNVARFLSPYHHSTREDLSLASFVCSQENACRYCYGTARAWLRLMGYSDEWIDRVERDVQLGDLDPRRRAVIDFTRQLARSSPCPAKAEYAALRKVGLSEEAIAELAAAVALEGFMNRLATCLAAPVETELEAMPSSPMFKFFGWIARPLFVRGFERRLHGPVRETLPVAGPFEEVLVPLKGIPATTLYRKGIDLALGSEVLPKRTKLLLFGVVSRSLGCGLCEGISRRLLEAEGMQTSDIDAALVNLASPALDRTESVLVPFARDTVRYETGAIQKRARAVCEQLGPDATLEAIGVAALANSVVRVAMLTAC